MLRYFRKDGHNWRKKKDGKTVKEAHERLKAESVDVLHCYYAHGEDNENFQRRTYWMLEESFMHIVLVHYLEVKGSKGSSSRSRDDNEMARTQMDSPVCSSSYSSQNQLPSQATDAGSPNSAYTTEYEDADSDYCQARSRYHSFLGLQQYEDGTLMDASLLPSNVPPPSLNQFDHQRLQAMTQETNLYSGLQDDIVVLGKTGHDLAASGYNTTQFDLTLRDEGLDNTAIGFPSASFQVSSEMEGAARLDISKQVTLTFGELLKDELTIHQRDDGKVELQFTNPELSYATSILNAKTDFPFEENLTIGKQPSLDLSSIGDGLKKYDSFSKWMSRELGEVEHPHMKSNSEADWNFMEGEHAEDSGMSQSEQLDAYMMGPSVSQDQLFSIVDFSPSWAYNCLETKVLITGKFLKDKEEVENIKLSCMFGEVEVPAEILADGILRCYAPPHKLGRVPFYITCSNRLACSEVREFEYRTNLPQHMETSNSSSCNTDEMSLHVRLGNLLSLESVDLSSSISTITDEKLHISNRISSLLMQADDKWYNMLKLSNGEEFSPDIVKDQLFQKLLKEKLHDWLLFKVAEGGKGPCVLDKDGQSVLHLTAALGFDWAIKPTIIAGVNVNFRDVNGWTALHWAAYCGKERTVVSLVTLGAAPGALTDPTPEFLSGRTPADLASGNGHKGIAGFLAESSLTSHLSALTVNDTNAIDLADTSDIKCVESVIPVVDGNEEAGHALKDSLSAVRNASLAAARIHQVYRVHSFQRKKLVEFDDDRCRISDEHALPPISIKTSKLISAKTSKLGQHDTPVLAAAIKIQNKYRGWKGRKEFLITRQRIVKIQAHVRGHQVRKRYKNWVWTVGIVEKAILRWRRKGSGLRGFRAEGLPEGPSMQTETSKEDDYDFLKEGRKQAEKRMEKALARVKSMVQYPEARDQYSRLLNDVSELQESNDIEDKILNVSEVAANDNIMIELDEIWEEDALMRGA